jgi:hypothetical protein
VQENEAARLIEHAGSCHCGRVKFTVIAPAEIEAIDCNCSICRKVGFLHLIVPRSRFKLLEGSEYLQTYKFNTGVATHLFCKVCGIKAFYIPRSNPDGYSVNVRCLDPATLRTVTVRPFDGKNWERNSASLAERSKE